MPELPEVETTRRDLEPHIVGRTITGVWVADDGLQPQAPLSVEQFRAAVVGRQIERLDRRGKYLLVALADGPWLVLHRRMTGNLVLRPPGAPPGRHVRGIFFLDGAGDGAVPSNSSRPLPALMAEHAAPSPRSPRSAPVTLHWEDQRRFGTWRLVLHREDAAPGLGPEPLESAWTAADLAGQLRGRGAPIKAVLLDQRRVAGLGNIYADEALHAAAIHPARPAASLSEGEVVRLHAAIRAVLEKAIRLQGSSARNYLGGLGQRGSMQDAWQVYERAGQPCYGCGGPVAKIRLAGRGTHYCPSCQALDGPPAGSAG